jgi:predicted 3-demethylubiquinone-9 3-methyltransferase (glyoxalase superfamily)
MAGTIRIGDLNLIVFNGGPYGEFNFNESMSLLVTCDDQDEVDHYWNGLSEGGEPHQCGWLKDRFGVSWQIVPKLFNELMSSSDAEGRERVFQAMMKMIKFDCAALQDAYDGETS